MTSALSALIVAFAAVTVAPVDTRDVEIPTKRGTKLEGRLSAPTDAGGLLPAVVLAPGLEYDMDKPLMKRTAERLAAGGFIALRFNWGFYTHNYKRSAGMFSELDDLRSALAYVRQAEGVDKDRVFVVGKSLGSVVAVELASDGEPMTGLVLLTVPLHVRKMPGELRPVADKLSGLELPMMIVSGAKDPSCDPDALEKLVRKCKKKPELLTVRGKHSLESKSPEVTAKSIETAVDGIFKWLHRQAKEE